jgi:hypothetical protein
MLLLSSGWETLSDAGKESQRELYRRTVNIFAGLKMIELWAADKELMFVM